MAKKTFSDAFFHEEGYTDPTPEELEENKKRFIKEKEDKDAKDRPDDKED